MSKIGRSGPQNAAILDTEKGMIEKDGTRILVIDDELVDKLKFIKEGEFIEGSGAETLKLVGDVIPVDKVEVVKRVKENLIRDYPLSAMELLAEVKKRLASATHNDVWQAIKENGMKDNRAYSAYNFRNKTQEDDYNRSGVMPSGTPSIYNAKAVDFLVSVLQANG